MNTAENCDKVYSGYEMNITDKAIPCTANENIVTSDKNNSQLRCMNHTSLVAEPDKGFAWCVLMASFIANIIIMGIVISKL